MDSSVAAEEEEASWGVSLRVSLPKELKKSPSFSEVVVIGMDVVICLVWLGENAAMDEMLEMIKQSVVSGMPRHRIMIRPVVFCCI